jgi:UDP-2-acetamido-2,6-beta-L-arabino-hexul-4-ose reductase
MKTILVTGSNGFIGRAVCMDLSLCDNIRLVRQTVDTTEAELHAGLARADVIFHFAGVNRPKDPAEYKSGNADLTREICSYLIEIGRSPQFVLSSSIQAKLDTAYGVSKKMAEDEVRKYGLRTGADVAIYRLPNVFGPGCRPNYNSVIATFCYNISRDLDITLNDPSFEMTLVYIGDVVAELVRVLNGVPTRQGKFCQVPVVHTIQLGKIVELLQQFKQSRIDLHVPNQGDSFVRKLYATYLSYLPTDRFSYPLEMHTDDRGSFTEFLKICGRGQVSLNISKPYITKGNHWHHTKNEKFLVVSGRGVIRLRLVNEVRDKVIEYFVSDTKFEVVDIPPGYTHNIENLGNSDMVTVMWANEPFDPERPDTVFEEV